MFILTFIINNKIERNEKIVIDYFHRGLFSAHTVRGQEKIRKYSSEINGKFFLQAVLPHHFHQQEQL
jgi:hypothetical protein